MNRRAATSHVPTDPSTPLENAWDDIETALDALEDRNATDARSAVERAIASLYRALRAMTE